MFSAGNGGIAGDSCAFNGYVNSIRTIAISAVNWDGSVPAFAEQCAAIMAVTYGQDMFPVRNLVPPMVSFLIDKTPYYSVFLVLFSKKPP